MKNLVDKLVAAGTITSKPLEEAFRKVDRADFVPDAHKLKAYEDRPLPIGLEQTISQPTTVAFMLELLRVEPGHKVLDVGSGSGWQTALLCEIVGAKGKVFAVERIKDLLEFGRRNVAAYNYSKAEFRLAGEKFGWPEKAPFDRIIAAAAADSPPAELLEQLKIGGFCVLPVKNSLVQIVRKSEDEFAHKEYPGFVFVPLIRY